MKLLMGLHLLSILSRLQIMSYKSFAQILLKSNLNLIMCLGQKITKVQEKLHLLLVLHWSFFLWKIIEPECIFCYAETVFQQTKPIVTSVLDGYNVCIFAYGQTGTGKTFTMEGTPEHRGVNYRTLEELFRITEERHDTMKYELSVSMLEVYNEKIRDLLVENSAEPTKKWVLRSLGVISIVGFSSYILEFNNHLHMMLMKTRSGNSCDILLCWIKILKKIKRNMTL